MALESLALLDKYKATPFTPGYPEAVRTFFAPVDDIHAVLTAVLGSATSSLAVAMFGFDDMQLSDILRKALESDHIFVQVSLDSTQAAGKTEKAILATWNNDRIGNSIAIGQSAKHAISHMKLAVIDGLDIVTGSTNWSSGGETRQDNQLTIIRDGSVAAQARQRLDLVHDSMLKQMIAKLAA